MNRKITGIIPNRIDENGVPVLTVEAYQFNSGKRSNGAYFQVVAWCERCRAWHYHGIPADHPPKGLTHRVAHCHVGVGTGGYYLEYDLTAPPINPKVAV
jgi:hypothetical protein